MRRRKPRNSYSPGANKDFRTSALTLSNQAYQTKDMPVSCQPSTKTVPWLLPALVSQHKPLCKAVITITWGGPMRL